MPRPLGSELPQRIQLLRCFLVSGAFDFGAVFLLHSFRYKSKITTAVIIVKKRNNK
jgi:hypothetical protein